MANQLQATVYQIDGNPQKSPIVLSFLTANIMMNEASLSTIPEVNSLITYYPNASNQLEVQLFYVSETMTTLVTNANATLVSQVQATVLEINQSPLKSGGAQYSFPVNSVSIWDYVSGDVNSYLEFKNKKYYVSETETTLVTNANNNSNIIGAQGPQGIQGPVGPQGAIGPVGPAGLTWKGAWASGTSYILNDAVGYDGASWFCILATSGTTTPNLDTTHWALLAAQGAQGPAGATGAQGPTGPQGPAGSAGYKVYSAILSWQSGGTGFGGTITANVLENTLGVSLTWSTDNNLFGYATAPSSVFTLGKTVVFPTSWVDGTSNNIPTNLSGQRISNTQVRVIPRITSTGSIQISYTSYIPFEIRVYL